VICPLSFGIGRCAVVFAAYVSHARPDLNYGHHQGVLRALFVRDPLKFKKRGQFFMGVASGVTGKEERRELPTRRSLVQGTTNKAPWNSYGVCGRESGLINETTQSGWRMIV